MATNWSVLVFGDSWAEYMHPCWPAVLGRRLSAQVHNFANAGSLCGDLAAQGQRALMSPQVPKAAGGLLKKETLVVVHTCGNDFIMKMVEALMGGGGLMAMFGGGGAAPPMAGPTPDIMQANPGAREAEMLRQFLDTMYRGGARHFLVSGVPAFLEMPVWNFVWPMIGTMVNQGKLQDLGVGPGDPPRLAMEVQQAALHERWESMCASFNEAHADAECVFFDEVGALERLRTNLGAANFDRSMWDMSMFHPTVYGHEQLASEAHRCMTENSAALSSLAPHLDVPAASRKSSQRGQQGGAQAAAEKTNSASEAKPAAAGATAATTPAAATAPAATSAGAAASATAPAPATPVAVPDFWDCPVCTLHNEPSASVCEACETPRPTADGESANPKLAAAEHISVRVRNVKGDVSFAVSCDKSWNAGRLKEAVLAAAPPGFATPGTSCILALKGKFLSDDAELLSALGVADGTQLIAVLRPAASGAGSAEAFSPPARS